MRVLVDHVGLCWSRRQFKSDCQLILVPKSTQDSKDYGEIKLASDTFLGIPSQVCVLYHCCCCE